MNRNVIRSKNHVCIHLKRRNECSVPECEHFDMRSKLDPVEQLFGTDSNSAAAAKLYRSDLAQYEELRRQAVSRGLLAPRLSDRAKALQIDVTEFNK